MNGFAGHPWRHRADRRCASLQLRIRWYGQSAVFAGAYRHVSRLVRCGAFGCGQSAAAAFALMRDVYAGTVGAQVISGSWTACGQMHFRCCSACAAGVKCCPTRADGCRISRWSAARWTNIVGGVRRVSIVKSAIDLSELRVDTTYMGLLYAAHAADFHRRGRRGRWWRLGGYFRQARLHRIRPTCAALSGVCPPAERGSPPGYRWWDVGARIVEALWTRCVCRLITVSDTMSEEFAGRSVKIWRRLRSCRQHPFMSVDERQSW